MRPRVLTLLNSFAIGGAEVFAIECALAMRGDDWDVEVARLRGREDLGRDLEEAGVPTHLVPWGGLYGFLRRGRYDVVQTHHTYAGAVGRVAARAAAVPAIVSTEQVVLDALPWKYRLAWDLTIGLADAVVCISKGVRDSVDKVGLVARGLRSDRFRIVPNGVNLAKLDPRASLTDRSAMRRSLGLADGDFVVGTVGRLVDQKGQEYLIEALPRILPALPGAKVVIVGRGELETRLRACAERERVADRVLFAGERRDVVEVMRAFDVFALPSKYEGLGVVLLEALSVRLPVVATRIAGVTDVVDETTGMLVPPRDPAALADAVVSLARDRARGAALAEAGRRRVEERFEIHAVAREYQDLYTQLLSRGHSA